MVRVRTTPAGRCHSNLHVKPCHSCLSVVCLCQQFARDRTNMSSSCPNCLHLFTAVNYRNTPRRIFLWVMMEGGGLWTFFLTLCICSNPLSQISVYGITHTSNRNGIHGICNKTAPWWVLGPLSSLIPPIMAEQLLIQVTGGRLLVSITVETGYMLIIEVGLPGE